MGKIRRGNYVFISWIGDHGNHVHVFKDRRLVVKWDERGSPLKIKSITINNKKKSFSVTLGKAEYEFPFSKLKLVPSRQNPIIEFRIDSELAREGVTYKLSSGEEGSFLSDEVLEHNKDSDYLRKMLLYKLTIQAQKVVNSERINKRELARRLKTSPSGLYRLLDQAFYGKTIDQMLRLLTALDCPVDIVFRRSA